MGILLFLLFGLVVGFVARAIMPGRQNFGWLATMAIGVGGSLLGGLVASALARHSPTRLEPAGIIGSILGALVVLAIAVRATRGRLGGRGLGGGRLSGTGHGPIRT